MIHFSFKHDKSDSAKRKKPESNDSAAKSKKKKHRRPLHLQSSNFSDQLVLELIKERERMIKNASSDSDDMDQPSNPDCLDQPEIPFSQPTSNIL